MTAMYRYSLTPLLLVLSFTACGTLTGRPTDEYWFKSDAKTFASATDSLLAYKAYVWPLSAAELAKENEQLRDALARDSGEFQRLRQIIAAAAPAAGLREHARAPQLIDQLERDGRGSRFATLLAALRAELAERRRIEDKLRDEARRADDVEQKLDALKNIEKSLIDRTGTPAGKKP